MHSTLSMYYDYDAHVKGELLVMMKNSQSVNLLISISNTLIEFSNDFGFDCDGIPKRLTMYLNLWSYKVVRHRYSNLMIQPELKGSTQGYPLVSIEVLSETSSCWFTHTVLSALRRFGTPDDWCSYILDGSRFIATCSHAHTLIDKHKDIMKAQVEFQRSFRHSNTERLSQSDEVLKLKNFKKDAILKLFKSTNQERYEHVGPEVTSSQDGKAYKMT
ncbi:hypothetical protein Tco_0429229 [Tanacetum coccineum]